MPTDVYRRFEVVLTFDSVRSSVTAQSGPLVAYADKSVWELFERLTSIIDSETEEYWLQIILLDRFRHEKESAIDRKDYDEGARIGGQELEVQRQLGEMSTIDLDEVRASCTSIIDAARKDLGP